jgi:hypothetical protein
MRHYPFLSVGHLLAKYTGRVFEPAELRRGWHGWRSRLRPDLIRLPSQNELRLYTSDDELDPSNPRTQEFADGWAAPEGWRRWFAGRSLP